MFDGTLQEACLRTEIHVDLQPSYLNKLFRIRDRVFVVCILFEKVAVD